jgi:hypothetical protein
MPAMVNGALGPMELKTLSTPVETARKSLADWRALVVRALSRAECSQKHAASDLGISEGQFSRQLAGTEHLSFWRMLSLPASFWAELIPLIVEFHGLNVGTTPQQRQREELGRLVEEVVLRVVTTR